MKCVKTFLFYNFFYYTSFSYLFTLAFVSNKEKNPRHFFVTAPYKLAPISKKDIN